MHWFSKSPGENKVHLLGLHPGLCKGQGHSFLLKLGFRLFPAFRLQAGVLEGLVKVCG